METAAQVLENWEKIKKKERAEIAGSPKSALDGIPKHLPALLQAYRSGEKASGVGFDWPDESGVRDKIAEEWKEFNDELKATPVNQDAVAEEFGDLLFSLVNLSRHLKIDPESALRSATNKFIGRFKKVEASLDERGQQPQDLDIEALEELWQKAKK